eukprot:CAMPEP_0178588072 /NCGR_PEP_ID=MMETSP0697-20121206/26819_1 /TAXON_ID=265572 /ORGANISM="Extubocellulus spinifer, Strain CCMP396" /LENGTH=298 /DNA_ID=CAMNT_0020224359 /DNA_START=84 /DNA_END=980 /DNA_ORIENTATION=-
MSDTVSHSFPDMHESTASSQSAPAACEGRPNARRRPRRSGIMSVPSIYLLSFVVSSAILFSGAAGFAPSTAQHATTFVRNQQRQYSSSGYTLHRRENNEHKHTLPSAELFMSSAAVASAERPSQGSRMSDFQKRMRNIVVNDSIRSKESTVGGKNGRPSNVKVVHTLNDYKVAVGNERDKVVVVRFYATWCKACRAMQPYFYKLAQTYKNVQFVEVPVTDKNANLHQGLGVPSLPFAHVYHPEGGLVEEMKINRRYVPKFAKVVHSYAQTSCNLVDGETANPYPDPDEVVKLSARVRV